MPSIEQLLSCVRADLLKVLVLLAGVALVLSNCSGIMWVAHMCGGWDATVPAANFVQQTISVSISFVLERKRIATFALCSGIA